MSVIRMQVAWQMDTAAPEDAILVNPHFKIIEPPAVGADYQSLCNDLLAGIDGWDTLTTQLTVTAYRADTPPPNYPLATAVARSGSVQSSPSNRDLALCLSYFATDNRPRKRGRLYIPCCVCAINGGANNATPANMTKVAALVPILTGLGGVNVDWVVWSRVDNVSRPVTNWFIDNAWDTQRRRGARATGRQQGTTSEDSAPNFVALASGYDVEAASAAAAAA